MNAYTLEQLSTHLGPALPADVRGDPATSVDGVCTLDPGAAGKLTFLANPRLRGLLPTTQAAAVIVGRRDAERLVGPGLVVADPGLAFARIARLFDRRLAFEPGVHPAAVVAADATIGAGAHVGPCAVVASGARIGAGAFVGAGCIIGRDARIGVGTRLEARVVVGSHCTIGDRCQVAPGAVIGSRGFGNVRGPNGWEEIPQLGSVVVGNDVEIGANTTIDRGALDDTVIEDNVRLDNQIQIAHNCRIGAHTAIAACTGIAGSTTVGKRCMIGGAAGLNGHIEIADDVILFGGSMVTHSIREKGAYGSALPTMPAPEYRRTVARVRRLGRLGERLREIEARLNLAPQREDDDEPG